MPATKDSLSISEARRVAIAAQHFIGAGGAPKNTRSVGGAGAATGRRADRLGQRSHSLALLADFLPARRLSLRAAGEGGLRAAPAVRILGPRSVVSARGALSAVPLAHGRRPQRRGHLGQVASLCDQPPGTGGLGAPTDPRARRVGRERARRRRQIQGQLVGLEPGQGNPGMAVLDRRCHDRAPSQFRAPLRLDRTRRAGGSQGVACAFARARTARVDADGRPSHGCRHRA